MQKLGDLNRWVPVGEGELLEFVGTRPRLLRIEVNASASTAFYVHVDGEDAPRFLARVEGFDTLEFYVPGAFTLMFKTPDPANVPDVLVRTADGSEQHRANMAEEVYTTLHTKAARDPAMERMQAAMMANNARVMAKLQKEMERRLAEQVDSRESAPVAPAGKRGSAKTGDQSSGGSGSTGGEEGSGDDDIDGGNNS